MAKYIFIAMVKDNGNYKAGDVVSIREPGSKVTALERKLFICTEVELTKTEAQTFIAKLRPQANYSHKTEPIPPVTADLAVAQKWCDDVEAGRAKLPVNGVQTNLSNIEIVARLSDLQDEKKEVPVFTVDKTTISLKV